MRLRISQSHLMLAGTTVVFVLLFAAASVAYANFFSLPNFIDILSNNAHVGIAALGMTFVILSGGIDLSVGAVLALTSVVVAVLVQHYHMSPGVAIPLTLAGGAAFGCIMGCLIYFFELAPFLVTLAGMFLARGLALMLSMTAISIDHPFFMQAADAAIPLGSGAALRMTAIIFLPALLVAIYLGSFTRFGRNVYAIGGNENSASLMGLPVGATKIAVYTLSGFCSALAGLAYVFATPSGYALHGVGMELDVIAAVVMGGTLLSGGVGHVLGTLVGILILGTIQNAITYDGRLSSWWTKIAIGLLVFLFVVLQRFLTLALRTRRA